MQNIIDEPERDGRQDQYDHKENKRTKEAILNAFSTRDFNAVKYPVGYKVKAGGDQCVVKDFQVEQGPKIMVSQEDYIMPLAFKVAFDQYYEK